MCWSAIFAGTIAAAALSLILFMLGTALGLSSLSPWAFNGVSATKFGVSAIVWISVTQVLASGMGGYLTGRLRTRWTAVHNDQVYFRDTAHGFLAWAVATLVTAAMLASAMGAIVSDGVQAGAVVSSAAVSGVASNATLASEKSCQPSHAGDYSMDALFRKDMASPAAVTQTAVTGVETSMSTPLPEVTRIFMNGLRIGTLPLPIIILIAIFT